MSNQFGLGAVAAISFTLGTFYVATVLNKRSGANPLCNPVLLTVTIIIATLSVGHISYEEYFQGAQVLHLLLGPAVVALAVPLYRQHETVRRFALPMLTGVVVGSSVGVSVAVLLARAFGAPDALVAALATKSITAPVAMGIATKIGGIPTLAAAIAVLTGMIVAVAGPWLLRRLGIHSNFAQGLAMGVAGHGQGTARILQDNEAAGAIAGLAMGLTALISAFLVPIAWRVVLV